VQHMLWSDRCIENSAFKPQFFCRHCHLDQPTKEKARHHFQTDRRCLDTMLMLEMPLGKEFYKPHLRQLQDTVKAANLRHGYLTRAIQYAVESINSVSSPRSGTLQKVTEHPNAGGDQDGGEVAKGSTKIRKFEKLPVKRIVDMRDKLEIRKFPVDHRGQVMPSAAVSKLLSKSSVKKSEVENSSEPVSIRKKAATTTTPLPKDAKTKSGGIGATPQSAQALPGIDPVPNSNTALAFQVQQLAEQVRLLTESLSSSTSPSAQNAFSQANVATVLPKEAADGKEHKAMETTQSRQRELEDVSPKLRIQKLPSKDIFREAQDLANERTSISRTPAKEGSEPFERAEPSFRRLEIQTNSKEDPSAADRALVNANAYEVEDQTNADESIPAELETQTNATQNLPVEDEVQTKANESVLAEVTSAHESRGDSQPLVRQIHTQARLLKSSNHPIVDPANALNQATTQARSQPSASSSQPAASPAVGKTEQSLWEELFPESINYVQPHYTGRSPYPKLEPPSSVDPIIRREEYDQPLSEQEQSAQTFQRSGERITVLQLLYCSMELTDADFRRVIPKGKHVEGWLRDGDFIKVVPGRDPISLERLPFYYLLFNTPASALAYQKNASRLHKLSRLHQPSSIMSPIPPPKGFLEEGEDINAATSSFLLAPTSAPLLLQMVMQPYNPHLRTLVEQGGYAPIVSNSSVGGKAIYKVLMHIEGYESSKIDFYQLLAQESYTRGIQWPFHNEQAGIHRLRDISNLRAKFLPVSSANPRAASHDRRRSTEDDAALEIFSQREENAADVNEMVMNQVYNRWIIDFDDEEAAKRFARLWNRRVLPINKSARHVSWRETEERRMCNTEYLWER
jgi:hypothetical protein